MPSRKTQDNAITRKTKATATSANTTTAASKVTKPAATTQTKRPRNKMALNTPCVCSWGDCTTEQKTHEVFRSIISDVMGRNKKETAYIDFSKVRVCRKHYQRTKYRNQKENGYADIWCKFVKKQLDVNEKQYPGLTYRFQLLKADQERPLDIAFASDAQLDALDEVLKAERSKKTKRLFAPWRWCADFHDQWVGEGKSKADAEELLDYQLRMIMTEQFEQLYKFEMIPEIDQWKKQQAVTAAAAATAATTTAAAAAQAAQVAAAVATAADALTMMKTGQSPASIAQPATATSSQPLTASATGAAGEEHDITGIMAHPPMMIPEGYHIVDGVFALAEPTPPSSVVSDLSEYSTSDEDEGSHFTPINRPVKRKRAPNDEETADEDSTDKESDGALSPRSVRIQKSARPTKRLRSSRA